jgi:hypothetical protein
MPGPLQSWDQLSHSRGRLELADLLFENYWYGTLDPADFSEALLDAWVGADHPESVINIKTWIELFLIVGYRVDGVPAERPAEPIVLYRGSTAQLRRRASWTADLGQAKTFAENTAFHTGLPTAVYRARFKPERLVAELTSQRGEGSGPGELEFIVDTRGARITELPA